MHLDGLCEGCLAHPFLFSEDCVAAWSGETGLFIVFNVHCLNEGHVAGIRGSLISLDVWSLWMGNPSRLARGWSWAERLCILISCQMNSGAGEQKQQTGEFWSGFIGGTVWGFLLGTVLCSIPRWPVINQWLWLDVPFFPAWNQKGLPMYEE